MKETANESVGASALLQLSPRDNVCAATRPLAAGDEVPFGGRRIRIASEILVGHKVAVTAIQEGEKVLKYGASIGSATRRIEVGEHVHTHNLKSDYLPSTGRATAAGGEGRQPTG